MNENDSIQSNDTVRPVQLRAIAALLAGHDQERAAQLAGVSAVTLRRWLRTDADFQAALAGAQSTLLKAAIDRMAVALHDNIIAIEGLRDGAQSESVRLSAAKSLMEMFHKFKEQSDFETRLTALERQHAQRTTTP